jgi:adenylosuccinate synthase
VLFRSEDKVARFGIMAKDLCADEPLRAKLHAALAYRQDVGKEPGRSLEELFFTARSFGKRLEPFLCDAGALLEEYFLKNRRVLFEGAQGTLLDIDHGTYPFVTSSNCVAAQASIGSGVGVNRLNEILLVSKAYCTRVGEGPFFTEVSSAEQERFRTAGNEFGATTGRPRRCGWLDLPALRYASRLNGASGLVLTKVDILPSLGPIKVGIDYSYQGKRGLSFVDAMELSGLGKNIDIIYQDFPKIDDIPEQVRKMTDFPKPLQELFALIENDVKIPIHMISYGPKRGQEFIP